MVLLATAGRDAFNAGDLRLLTILAGQTATAIANARLHQATRRDAETDGLTGLLNHQAILARLEHAAGRADAHRPLSAIMVDFNLFKRINDTDGHPVGNDILRGVGAMPRRGCRATDASGRYGGDEFIVVLPNTPPEEAEALARRLEASAAAQPVLAPTGRAILPRLNLGVASLPEDGTDASALVAAADRRLYRAKSLAVGAPVLTVGGAAPTALDLAPDPDRAGVASIDVRGAVE